MKTKQMTARQYAEEVKKCKRQYILKLLKKNQLQKLPDVIDFKKVGSYYVLEVIA